MILHYKDINLSNDFSFIPIEYNHLDFLIQTPTLFSPFNINEYQNNKKYLILSFQDKKDISTNNFIENCLHIFYRKAYDKYSKNYHIQEFVKKNKCSDCMRFKVPDYCQFYDHNKNLINKFPNKVFGSFIIQLTGLWVLNNNIIFNWIIIQGKINLPIKLNQFKIIEEDRHLIKKIPPPPPLPLSQTKYNKTIRTKPPEKKVNKNKSYHLAIQESDLKNIKLKKIKPISIKNNIINTSELPSLEEIRIALKTLKNINL